MNLRISDTFTAALARLPAQAQKAVKTTAFDLQLDPSRPGLAFHRVERARDPDFWTVRVNDDIRIVVHKRGADLLLAYVDRHDDAYRWAERRRLDVHPSTGAVQLVEVRERVDTVAAPLAPAPRPAAPKPTAPKPTAAPPPARPKPRLFAGRPDDVLLACGVPEDWLADVRAVDEDGLFDLAAHLPAEAAEALLNLAVGILPPPPAPPAADPYAHPDALRRFRVMENRAELEAALDAPWEAWTVFLHPSQRDFVERDFAGPARVTGSAGTGKTVVALHRAARLARRDSEARILLATFTEALAAALRLKLRSLLGAEPEVMRRVTVRHLEGLAAELHDARIGPLEIAAEDQVAAALAEAKAAAGATFTDAFLLDEWTHLVDGWNIRTAEAYADVPRLGRKTRVGGKQRDVLWQVMAGARARLEARGLSTWSMAFDRLAPLVAADPPFDAAVIDEAQDLSVAELRFLAAMAPAPEALFFAGDVGQRIFRQPFSWSALGVDIRGRSRILKVNYRTSHQIRARADRLLPTLLSDVDGAEESRTGVVSVFGGPEPDILVAADAEDEVEAVARWLAARRAEGVAADEIGVVARTVAQLGRAEAACDAAGLPWARLTGAAAPGAGRATVCTMHLAKGLEFRAVAVMACDEDVVPLASRLAAAATEAELREVYETERHLLYVACTRARDWLLVSGVTPASEFVEDLR